MMLRPSPFPADSSDFNKLALQLSRKLPRDAQLPPTGQAVERWRQRKLKLLREIVRVRSYQLHAEQVANNGKNGIQATFWRLRLDDVWTLPAVELSTDKSGATAIVVADDGYKNAALKIQQLLSDGYRILALDPFYVGGSKIAKRGYSREHRGDCKQVCIGLVATQDGFPLAYEAR